MQNDIKRHKNNKKRQKNNHKILLLQNAIQFFRQPERFIVIARFDEVKSWQSLKNGNAKRFSGNLKTQKTGKKLFFTDQTAKTVAKMQQTP